MSAAEQDLQNEENAELSEADRADEDGASEADGVDEELTIEQKLVDAEAKASDNWDKYLRSVAELDNVRKRASRDVENAHKFAVEKFANDMLAVVDSLAMGLDAADSGSTDKLREGSAATLKLLLQTFERFGISELDPHGEPFDPQFHEAMTMQPSADAEPNTVLMVVQRGYLLNGRLLRPARVVVAAAPAGT